jgi:hypothetical protein
MGKREEGAKKGPAFAGGTLIIEVVVRSCMQDLSVVQTLCMRSLQKRWVGGVSTDRPRRSLNLNAYGVHVRA